MTHSTRSPFVAAACGAVAVIGLGLFSSLAFAALSPLAIDADSDGAWIAVVDTNGDGKLDHLDIGVKASEYDCDDVYDTVSPLLTEIVGNKTDDDCSSGIPVNHITGDAKWPVSDDELARWKANWPIPWSDLGFIASHGRLSAAGSHVTIVKLASGEEAGTFKVDEGYQAGDWITGSLPADREFSAVKVKADGILDVFTDSEVEHVTRLTPAKPRSSGLGKKAVTEIADKSAEDAVRPLREEFLLATGELRAVDTVLAQGIDKLWKADEDLAEGLAAEERARFDADVDEKAARIEADRLLAEAADKAQRKAEKAERDAGTALEVGQTAQSHGPLVEGYGLVGVVAGRPVEGGRRNSLGVGGGAGLNLGVDGAGFRANAFVDGMVGTDGGEGPAFSWAIGGESTFDVGGNVHLGPFGAFSQRFTNVNALESNAVGRIPLVGLSLAAPLGNGGAGHGLFQARVGCGPEFIGVGMSGDVDSDIGVGCRATVGIGGGVGALRR